MATLAQAIAQDEFFEIAVNRFVNTTDRSNAIVTTTDGSTGLRRRRVVESVLTGNVTSFSNDGASITNFNAEENDVFNNKFMMDMLEGLQLAYLDKLNAETPEDFQSRPGKHSYNFFSLMVDMSTQLYNDPPERKFLGKDEKEMGKEDLADITKQYKLAGINSAMQTVDRFCEVFGDCLVRPVFRPNKMDEEKNRYAFAVVPKTDYRLLIADDEVTKQKEIKAVVFVESESSQDEKGRMVLRMNHIVWTDKFFAVFKGGALEQEQVEENPYGVIPYLHCTQDLNFERRFRQPDKLEDANVNVEINEVSSLSGFHIRFAGMPITVVKDSYGAEQIEFKMTPGFVLSLDSVPDQQQAQLEFAAPQDRIQAFKTQIDGLLAKLFQSNGINYSMTEGIKSGTSGITLQVSMAPVIAKMKRRAPVDLQIENDLYTLWRTVAKVDSNEDFPEVSSIDVDYGLGTTFLGVSELREHVKFLLDSNLIDRAGALMMMHPTRYRTREEAEDALPEEKAPPMMPGMAPGMTPDQQLPQDKIERQNQFGANKPTNDDNPNGE